MQLRILINNYKSTKENPYSGTVYGYSGTTYLYGDYGDVYFRTALVDKTLFLDGYGYVKVKNVIDSNTLYLYEPLTNQISGKRFQYYEDISNALVNIGDIGKRIEGDKLYQSGTILYEEIESTFYYDDTDLQNSAIETIRTFFEYSVLDYSKKYNIILRLCKSPQEEKTIYYGVVDFSSIKFTTLPFENSLKRKVIKFNILDKISALNSLNLFDLPRGNWQKLSSRYFGQHGNISSLGTNQWEHFYLKPHDLMLAQFDPFVFSYTDIKQRMVIVVPTYYTHNTVNSTLTCTYMNSSSEYLVINNANYFSLLDSEIVTITTPSPHNLTENDIGKIIFIEGDSSFPPYLKGNYVITNILNATKFQTKRNHTIYMVDKQVKIEILNENDAKIKKGETITLNYPYYDFVKQINLYENKTHEQYKYIVIDSGIIKNPYDSRYYTWVKIQPYVLSMLNCNSPDYNSQDLQTATNIKFYTISYVSNTFYDNIANSIDIMEYDNERKRYEIKYIDALKIIRKIVSNVFPDINFVNILYNTDGTLKSEFRIPSGEAIFLTSNMPFEKKPLDAIIMLSKLMDAYFFVNKEGNLVLQNKNSFSFTQTLPQNSVIKQYLNEVEESYIWDNIYDSVEVYLKTYIPYLKDGNWEGQYIDGAGSKSLYAGIEPRNKLSIDLLLSNDKLEEENITILPNGLIEVPSGKTEFDVLNELADKYALIYYNFYSKRRSSYSLNLNKIDFEFADWDVCDKYEFYGNIGFLTKFSLNVYQNTFNAEFISLNGEDFYDDFLVMLPKLNDGILSGYGTSSYAKSSNNAVRLGFSGSYYSTSSISEAILKTIGEQKGDLITFTGNASPVRLPVGSNYSFLIAKNSDVKGLSWASASSPISILTESGIDTLKLSYNATNLKLTDNALNTIQDIATNSIPTFSQVILSNAGSSNQAVRGDRTISTSFPLTGGGDLTANRTLSLSYNAINLKLTDNALNTIQDIATNSTPTFSQVILSNAGTSTQAVRGDRSIATSYPLTGGGDLTSNRTLSLSYNAINLKLTDNTLNTIQDIATTSSPTFMNLTLNGVITVNGTGTSLFSSDISHNGNKSIYNNFSNPGWTGTGWRLDYGVTYTNSSHLEIDNLTVRKSMRVYELIINQIRGTNGSLLVSSVAKTMHDNDLSGEPVVLFFENPEGSNVVPFFPNDIILCHRVRLDSQIVLKTIILKVISTSNNSAVVEILERYPANAEINRGDVFGRIGNTTNENRQGGLYLTSDDVGSPYMMVFNGVNSVAAWNNSAKNKVIIGRLHSIVTENFGTLINQYGLYSKGNVWLESANYNNSSLSLRVDSEPGLLVKARINDNESYLISVGKIYTNLGYQSRYGLSLKDTAGNDYFELSNNIKHIAGWSFDTQKFNKGTDIELNSSTKSIGVNSNKVKLFYSSNSYWGLEGYDSSNNLMFQLGSTNKISGWNFDTTKFWNDIVSLEASSTMKGLVVDTDKIKIGKFTYGTMSNLYSNINTIVLNGYEFINQNDSYWGINGHYYIYSTPYTPGLLLYNNYANTYIDTEVSSWDYRLVHRLFYHADYILGKTIRHKIKIHFTLGAEQLAYSGGRFEIAIRYYNSSWQTVYRQVIYEEVISDNLSTTYTIDKSNGIEFTVPANIPNVETVYIEYCFSGGGQSGTYIPYNMDISDFYIEAYLNYKTWVNEKGMFIYNSPNNYLKLFDTYTELNLPIIKIRGKQIVRFHGILSTHPTSDVEVGDIYIRLSDKKVLCCVEVNNLGVPQWSLLN